ncbi:MAG: MFS transporter [Deltaproteobacteria bacterium]|nr:MFS transporter [Deltaproteobacteria bacterium]
MQDQPASPTSPAGRTPWAAVLILIGAGVAASFQVGKAPPVLTAMREEFGMSLFLAGWILGTFNVIGLALGSFSGAVADALGHRRLLILGLFTQAAASLAGGLSQHIRLLFFSRVLEGLGFLVVAVCGPALIVRLARARDLRLALSGWSCYVPTGMSAIMLIAPLITGPFGWRGLWIFNALILGGYALLVRAFIPRAPRRGDPMGGILSRIFRDLLRTSTSLGPILLALTFSTYTLQWLAVMGFLPTLLVEQYGLGTGLASILTAVVVAANVPGNLAGGWLMGKGAGRRSLIATASLLMGLSSLVIYAEGFPFWLRYAGCLFFAGIGGLLPAAVISGAPVHAPTPNLVATTNGLLMQGSQLGQVAGPPALALLISRAGGWHAAPWLLCGSAGLGILLSFWLAFLERPR